jgi:phosphoribosylformimino-5-aminoimidazole carboxamide ribotide isomerase
MVGREGRVLIIPAIDLRGGRCVRLQQGDYSRETVFGDDPAAMARCWAEQGAELLHVVDLDGAKAGNPVNVDAIRAIVQSAGVPCELGGGLRTEADLALALGVGVQRLVIGTQALKAPDWFARMARTYPDKLLLGLDAKEGRVATHGWLDVAETRAVELAQRLQDLPLAGVIYTDIARDGMLQGPNVKALEDMTAAVRLPVIASGGVTTLEDIRKLKELPLAGCIVGRALYEKTIDLKAAINAVQRS